MLTLHADDVPVFDRDFDRFLAFLNGDTKRPLISPKIFALVFNFDIQSLATAARVHRNTVARAPESEGVQRYLRDSVRVVRAAADVSHSIEKAIFWYKNYPIPTFDYKTAQQLVSEGRTDDLILYMQSLQTGFSG